MTYPSDVDSPVKLAAIIYRSGVDDIDYLLGAFAADLIREGHRVGGVVQHNVEGPQGPRDQMDLIDLMTGRAIPISQPHASAPGGCRLDAAGLAEAAASVSRAIAEAVDLVVVNKFSKQEALGAGLRAEIAEAAATGLPVLTAVSEKCVADWSAFTAGLGTTLVCNRNVVDAWWQDVSWRESRTGVLARLEQRYGPIQGRIPSNVVPLRRRSLADHDVRRIDYR